MQKKKRMLVILKWMMNKELVFLIGVFLVWFLLANPARCQTTYPAYYIEVVIGKAEAFTGVSYRLGGDGVKTIDCSLLAKLSFRAAGIDIPRTSREQAAYPYGEDIRSIPDLQKGDLVFFGYGGRINHVGLVVSTIGGVVIFIHASSDRGCVAKDVLAGKWAGKFIKAKRLFETINPKGGIQGYAQGSLLNGSQLVSESSRTHDKLSFPAPSTASYDRDYITTNLPGRYPEASQRPLSDKELSKLSKWQLRVMRNEIFARHGYEFHLNPAVIAYFQQQEWYNSIQPKTRDSSYIYSFRMLEIERENIRLIQMHEGR